MITILLKVLIIQSLQFKMTKEEIAKLVQENQLDWRPDNISIFMDTTFPNSTVLSRDGNDYIVYMTGPRNEVDSNVWRFETETEAIKFLINKVKEEREIAQRYEERFGEKWTPKSPV